MTHQGEPETLLWRALANVVDNATRAAGQAGRVEVVIGQASQTVIDVIDDGPGFGNGPPGTASLGLQVVDIAARILRRQPARCIHPRRVGTRVRIALPGGQPPRRTRRWPVRAPGVWWVISMADLVIGDDHAVFLDALSTVLAPARFRRHRRAERGRDG